ncbi:hypothetical protein YC2023_090922 [Brassica napus]
MQMQEPELKITRGSSVHNFKSSILYQFDHFKNRDSTREEPYERVRDRRSLGREGASERESVGEERPSERESVWRWVSTELESATQHIHQTKR